MTRCFQILPGHKKAQLSDLPASSTLSGNTRSTGRLLLLGICLGRLLSFSTIGLGLADITSTWRGADPKSQGYHNSPWTNVIFFGHRNTGKICKSLLIIPTEDVLYGIEVARG